jgi:hypothetical protein
MGDDPINIEMRQWLQNLLKDVNIHIHIHNDTEAAVAAGQVRTLTNLLSRSRSKLQHALEVANHSAAPSAQPNVKELHLKNPLDIAIDELTTEVSAITSVADSAIALINGIPALIDAAVEKALAAGASPEELGAITGLSENLKTKAAALAAAVEANTTAIPPVVPPVAAITGITPTSGFDGTTIVIAGAGFGSKGSVTLSGQPCEVFSYSDTSITTTVPVGSSPGPTDVTVDVVVTTEGGAAVTAQFTVTPDPNA